MPVTAAMFANTAIGLGKAAYGAYQYNQGANMAKGLKRPANPPYSIPGAENDYLANAKTMAGRTQLPGQRIMEQKLGANTASGANSMKDSADSSAGLIAGIAGLKNSQNNAQNDIGLAAANYQDQNQQRLQSALQEYAGYQDKAFQYNKIAPYQSAVNQYNLDYNKAEGMMGAGTQNMFGGATDIGNAAGIYGGSRGSLKGLQPNDPTINNGTDPATIGYKSGGLIGKYNTEKRRGFKGNYNSWLATQNAEGTSFMDLK